MPTALKKQVSERANFQCEYCLLPQSASMYALQIDHIIPEKQGGPTILLNLALACRTCNQYKGYSVVKHYYESGKTILLFNPRQEDWNDHFMLKENGVIASVSETGQATIDVLMMNETIRVEGRLLLISNEILTAS